MKKVFKYQLSWYDPSGHAIKGRALSVGVQGGTPMLWAEYDDAQPSRVAVFYIFGTGASIPSTYNYVGTFFDAPFVWHVYEEA